MNIMHFTSAPTVLHQMAEIVASLSVETIQSNDNLRTACLNVQAACQSLSMNIDVLLSLDEEDDIEETVTDSDVGEVCIV
jgi:hypothetical protein